MNESKQVTRRTFLGKSAGLSAASVAAPYVLSSRAFGETTAANDSIRLGFIGIGKRATGILLEFLKEPDVEIVAMCDVWKKNLDAAVEKCPVPPKTYHDYRELLASDEVDAVVIGTPPHWHALQAIAACEAGKDVYMEKPMTLSVGEALAVKRAVDKHNTITQIGTQVHAQRNYRDVVDVVQSGVLGKIGVVRTFHVDNQGPGGLAAMPDGDPPAGLDWDLWCGPARKPTFNPLIVKGAYEHGSFMDYSGGWTPGMAPHILDLPYWAMELGHPTAVSAIGARYAIGGAGDGYDSHEAQFQYPGFTMTWCSSMMNAFGLSDPNGKKRSLAISFQGLDATLVSDYGTHDIFPERDVEIDTEQIPKITPDSTGHYREFLDCMRTRKQPSCHVGYHYKIDVAIGLSLMAMKLGRTVHFDPETETVPNDAEANKLFFAPYRDPWELPKEYI